MTTSLSTRSATAVQRLNDLRQQKIIAGTGDDFKQRRNQIVAEQGAFLALAQGVKLLNSHNIAVAVPQLIHFLQTQFAKIQTDFQDQPDTLTRANLQLVFRQSAKCREELAMALLVAWQGYVDKERLNLDSAILSVLSGVPSFREAVSDLQNLDDKIDVHRGQVPQNEEGFNALKIDMDEMQRIWNDLGGAGLPPEVLNFFRVAGNRGIGASLELLDKVRPWLSERGLEASFRVVISG